MSEERKIIQAMPKTPMVNLSASASVLEAARIMSKMKCGSCLVIDPVTEDLVGIVTERDVLTKVVAKALDPSKTALGSVMTKNPQCVSPNSSVANALFIMKENNFRHVPVVDKGIVLGIFSIKDAMPHELTAADNLSERFEAIANSIC